MAWSFVKQAEIVAGGTRITYGSYSTSSTETGGDVYTGLQKVYGMILQPKGSAVATNVPVINETFPIVDPVTIVQDASGDGYWMAWGC